MFRYLLGFSFALAALAQEYKLEPLPSPPNDLPTAYSSVLESKGYRIASPSGSWCEIWFAKSIATGPASSDSTIVLPIPQGTLLGVLRFPGNGSDRRGQSLKPGIYTLRYSLNPVDGAHQGVAPQRDFGLLTPISQDADPLAKPDYAKLVELSRTSGTAHPAVLSLETPSGTQFPALTKEGEQDVVLNVQAGNLKLAVIVVGKADS